MGKALSFLRGLLTVLFAVSAFILVMTVVSPHIPPSWTGGTRLDLFDDVDDAATTRFSLLASVLSLLGVLLTHWLATLRERRQADTARKQNRRFDAQTRLTEMRISELERKQSGDAPEESTRTPSST